MIKRIYHRLGVLLVVVLGLSYNSSEVEAFEGDKACIYTVDTPDSIRVDCFGAGSVCSGVADCPAPQLGFKS
jgi:hypothetical protein